MARRLTMTRHQIEEILPDALTSSLGNIPGMSRRQSESVIKPTYFCHICFQNYPIEEGFTVSTCQHQFCIECIKQFIINKINHGQVNITCFHPLSSDASNLETCASIIPEDDIHKLIDDESWSKYLKFKSNLQNTYSRQCPYCDHTQIGSPEDPIMTCENTECNQKYCLFHNNAHPMDMNCEEYELSIAKECKMNEMLINEYGDKCKQCPQCKFQIFKLGGCNHMKCVKCNCSFCWLCEEIIEDGHIPRHYTDPESACHGLQFEGMESEDLPVPRSCALCLLIFFLIIYGIPSMIMGIIIALLVNYTIQSLRVHQK